MLYACTVSPPQSVHMKQNSPGRHKSVAGYEVQVSTLHLSIHPVLRVRLSAPYCHTDTGQCRYCRAHITLPLMEYNGTEVMGIVCRKE